MRTPIAIIASKGPLAADADGCVTDLLRSDVEDERRSVALISLVEGAACSWEAV